MVLTYQPGVTSRGAQDNTIAATGQPTLPESVAARNLVPFTDQGWDRLIGNAWNYLKRSSSKDANIVVDATAPYSPPNVLRIAFTPELENDRQPTVHWIGLPFVREVYATWWIKLSPNWTPNPAGGGKMAFLWPPQGNGALYSNIGGARPPHHIDIVTTWDAYGYKFWEPNVAASDFYYDRWYRIQWYVRWESSPGAGDGVLGGVQRRDPHALGEGRGDQVLHRSRGLHEVDPGLVELLPLLLADEEGEAHGCLRNRAMRAGCLHRKCRSRDRSGDKNRGCFPRNFHVRPKKTPSEGADLERGKFGRPMRYSAHPRAPQRETTTGCPTPMSRSRDVAPAPGSRIRMHGTAEAGPLMRSLPLGKTGAPGLNWRTLGRFMARCDRPLRPTRPSWPQTPERS